MNKEIKIKKLLNWYAVMLVVGVSGLLICLKDVKAEQKCPDGITCYPASSCPTGQDEVGTCKYTVGNEEKNGKCCKSKSGSSGGGILPAETGGKCPADTPNCGNYTLNDMVQTFANIATWILGITGSLALAFFIYGGIMFMVSGGNSDRVNQAKQILIGAVIGLIIVFASYMIINFIFNSMGLKWEGKSVFPTEFPTEKK